MPDISGKPRRASRKNLYIALTILFLLGYVGAMIADTALPADLFWLVALLALASVVFTFAWARALDEVAISAHYESWYWGGSAGLSVSALIFLALAPKLMSGDAFTAFQTPQLGLPYDSFVFMLGFALALVPALIGYMVLWAVFWLRRR